MREEEQTRPWALTLLQAMRLAAFGLALAALLLSQGRCAAAGEARTVIPMGRAVGIKLFSDGVLVVGLADVPGQAGSAAPARACGLKQGDIITHINDTQVDTIEQVREVLQDLEGDQMSIRAMRGTSRSSPPPRRSPATTEPISWGPGSGTPWPASAP